MPQVGRRCRRLGLDVFRVGHCGSVAPAYPGRTRRVNVAESVDSLRQAQPRPHIVADGRRLLAAAAALLAQSSAAAAAVVGSCCCSAAETAGQVELRRRPVPPLTLPSNPATGDDSASPQPAAACVRIANAWSSRRAADGMFVSTDSSQRAARSSRRVQVNRLDVPPPALVHAMT